jgi:hypothetical protein
VPNGVACERQFFNCILPEDQRRTAGSVAAKVVWQGFSFRILLRGNDLPGAVRRILARRVSHVDYRHNLVTIGLINSRKTPTGQLTAREASTDAHAVFIRPILGAQSLIQIA